MGRVGIDANRVKLFQREADNFEGLGKFEGIILNSVAQYFPGVDYLIRVIESAVKHVADGGFIFLGDLRSLPLQDAYHVSVQFNRAKESLSADELRYKVNLRARQEEELLVDPKLFQALAERLPLIKHIEIKPKGGRALNELTEFRYSAILRIGQTPPLVKIERWEVCEDGGETLDQVRQLLKKEQSEAIGFRGLANKRLGRTVSLMRRLETAGKLECAAALREELAREAVAGVEPEELYDLAKELNYAVEISWARHGMDGRYDVAFWREKETDVPNSRVAFDSLKAAHTRFGEYGNDPLLGKRIRQVVSQVKSHLQDKLPDYMVPSSIMILRSIPLTENGKVDRKALPKPEWDRVELAGECAEARNPVEARLVGIWREVLGLERVGVHDNFFELGGDST